jgi:glycosyltransferase involved in cell wall biosynthesis
MKIALLSFYSGVIYRGVETFVHELSNQLVLLGHDVTVYQIGEVLPKARYKTISIHVDVDWSKKGTYTPFINYYCLKVKEFTQKTLKVIDKDTNIVFPTNGQWQSVLCSIWAKRHNKKMVIAGQSGPGLDDRINILTFPNRFVGLTEFQKKWAENANPLVQSVEIPNGASLNDFGLSGSIVSPKLKKPVVLCVSALDYWKRLDLVIKAVSKLDNVSLLLVGKGSEEPELKRLGDKLLPNRFKIMSFMHKDMPQVYRSADLFTFSTVPWESFGIVLVEAMASGLPVVATDDPIRREIVGDAGLFVDPIDTDAYAAAIQKALDTDWGNKPRLQAEKFSWDKIAKQYETLFNSL